MVWKIGLYLVLSLAFVVVFGGTQEAIGLSYDQMMLPQLAPAFAFFTITLIFKQLRMSVHFEINGKTILKSFLALLIPFVLLGFSFFIYNLTGVKTEIIKDLSPLFSFMLLGIFIGAIGEELGWRSFLKPTLEKKYSSLLSSVITGLLWGLWHVGQYQNGSVFMLFFLLLMISFSVILTFILQNTNNNIIISTLFHVSINLGFYVFFKKSLSEFSTIATCALIVSGFATSLLLLKRFKI